MNIASLVRSGNEHLSSYLLERIMKTEDNKTYGYSREHLDCLSSTLTELHFKKSLMLKQNYT